MGLNSPLPVRLPDECRKASNIVRSFVDAGNHGLDRVIPRSVLERAAGFAIFTVFKAGFMFSARAGSGIVIARLEDGSWSPPSAIGLGGFGFGGQLGAEVTDFLIVLNSRSAVASFMSAGSLTLGGNLSVAVGPLGRNAEGSGSVNTKGRLAAMYSYSKTKGLFGGVSVEGSVIVERQDANRLAYGGNPSAKQILSGTFPAPDWARVLVDQLDMATGLPGGQKWVPADDEAWGPDERARDYAFGEGLGAGGAGGTSAGRRSRAGSLFSTPASAAPASPPGQSPSKERAGPARPWENRRASSFNPFSGGSGSGSPRRGPPGPSSEAYNATGVAYPSRSRAGSVATAGGFGSPLKQSPAAEPLAPTSPFASADDGPDLLRDTGSDTSSPSRRGGAREADLLGTWDADGAGLTASFGRLTAKSRGNGNGNGHAPTPSPPLDGSRRPSAQSRSEVIYEHPDAAYEPRETTSAFALAGRDWDARRLGGAGPGGPGGVVGAGAGRPKARPVSAYVSSSPRFDAEPEDPFAPEQRARASSAARPFDQYFPPAATPPPALPPAPRLGTRAGLRGADADGYARALALFDFGATHAGDLGFRKGDVLAVVDKVGDKGEWWVGTAADGRRGMFPRDYVEVVEIPKELRGGVWRSDLRRRVVGFEFE